MTLSIGTRYLVIIPVVDDNRKPVLDEQGKQKIVRIPAVCSAFFSHPVAGEAAQFTFSSGKSTVIWKDQAKERLVEGDMVKLAVQTVTW